MQKGSICFFIQKHLEPFSIHPSIYWYRAYIHKCYIQGIMCDSSTHQSVLYCLYKDVLARSAEGQLKVTQGQLKVTHGQLKVTQGHLKVTQKGNTLRSVSNLEASSHITWFSFL